MKRRTGRKIWIDLDNSPHVLFFKPIIEELRSLGHEIFITARDTYRSATLPTVTAWNTRESAGITEKTRQ